MHDTYSTYKTRTYKTQQASPSERSGQPRNVSHGQAVSNHSLESLFMNKLSSLLVAAAFAFTAVGAQAAAHAAAAPASGAAMKKEAKKAEKKASAPAKKASAAKKAGKKASAAK